MARKTTPSEVIAVLGYGSQGRAMALNLRDSGYNVIIGLRRNSKSRAIARVDGHSRIVSVREAAAQADVICFAFPDHRHGRVFREQIAESLSVGATLWFLAGMSIHFRLVEPPYDCDVILIAPHAPGVTVRQHYLTGQVFSAFSAVYRDRSGRADRTILKLARAIGIPRFSLVSTSFEAEAIGDLFGEQAVLCGGMAALIKSGFEVLVENGLDPDHAYLEVAHQLDLIIDLIKRFGIEGMLQRISVVARLGSVETGPRLIDDSVKKRMQQVFNEIESGRFARRLDRLTDREIARLSRRGKYLSSPRLERAAHKFGHGPKTGDRPSGHFSKKC